MIRSIQFAASHYAARLQCIGSRKFTFPDKGLIVLFGPNGCGKSTLLRGMAHGTSAERGGWSRPPEPSLGSAEKPMGQILERWGSVVDWDGTASLYLDSSASDNAPRDLEENSDGLAEGDGEIMDTNIRRIFSPCSSGLWRISRLNKALDSLREGKHPRSLVCPNGRILAQLCLGRSRAEVCRACQIPQPHRDARPPAR